MYWQDGVGGVDDDMTIQKLGTTCIKHTTHDGDFPEVFSSPILFEFLFSVENAKPIIYAHNLFPTQCFHQSGQRHRLYIPHVENLPLQPSRYVTDHRSNYFAQEH
jgi:hypothetical protein